MVGLNRIKLLSILCLYIIVIIYIGFLSIKKNTSSKEFFIGDKNVSGIITAFLIQASDMSGWLFMAFPGAICLFGLGKIWIGVGLLIGSCLNWLIISKRLRRYSLSNNSSTIPEFLTKRFEDKNKIILLISSIFIGIFFLVYTSSSFVAFGKFINHVFGINYKLSVLIGIFVILIYMLFGGFNSVCITNFIQGIIILLAILIVPIVSYFFIGYDNFIKLIHCSNLPHNFFNPFYNSLNKVDYISIISQLSWGLGYFGMPHILVGFMSIKNEKEVKKSMSIGIIWNFISISMAVFIGIIGRLYLKNIDNYENVFISLINLIFIKNYKLVIISGFLLCSVIAAIISTAAMQLLVSSSAFVKDIYNDIIKKNNIKDKNIIFIIRVFIIIIAFICYLIAVNPNNSIMKLVSNAWSCFGSTFGPVICVSLFYKRANLKGVVSGMISGGLVVCIWDYICFNGYTLYSITGLYSLVVGFLINILVIIIVSNLTEKPSENLINEFNKVKNNAF